MLRNIFIAAFVSVVLAASSAYAQVAGMPQATIQGVTVGAWFGISDPGVCAFLGELTPSGWQLMRGPTACVSQSGIQGAIDVDGGPTGYIQKEVVPQFNYTLAARFGGSSGNSPVDQLNTANSTAFAFKIGADGHSVTFDHK